MKTCSVDLCDRPHYAKGFCKMHWERIYRNGNLKRKIGFASSKPSLSLQRLRQSQIEEAFFQARKVVKPYRASLDF